MSVSVIVCGHIGLLRAFGACTVRRLLYGSDAVMMTLAEAKQLLARVQQVVGQRLLKAEVKWTFSRGRS
jgi:hypothetical protein